MLKHYVEYLYEQGLSINGASICEVSKRDVSEIKLPENALGFRFFDREIVSTDNEVFVGERKNFSGWYYEGETMTIEQLKESLGGAGKYSILVHNMEVNGCSTVIKTKFGQYIPLFQNDNVI